MKSLNENWFAITLVAVIFVLLGFLIGKTSGKHQQDKNLHKVFMKDLKGCDGNTYNNSCEAFNWYGVIAYEDGPCN